MIGLASCHRATPVEAPVDRQARAPSEPHATIVVRGAAAGWDASSARATRAGNSLTVFGRSSPRFAGRFDGGRLTVECPVGAMCQVGLQHRDGATTMFEVVAADPIVEVELTDLSRTRGIPVPSRTRYVDPRSRSARIAELLAEELALTQACQGLPAGKCGTVFVMPDPQRVVAGHDPGAAIDRLRATVPREDETLATWAYFSAGCPHAELDAELAREALREPIDPIATKLWPVGLARAILAAEGPAGADERLERMRGDENDRDVAAATLIELMHEARARRDLERAAELRATLHSRGPWTNSPLATYLPADRRIVGAAVGSLSMVTLAGEAHDVAQMKGTPTLLYTAAAWCKPCADGLPELRAVADAHPELAVLFVMLDDEDTAIAWARDHAPIPGTPVVADQSARAKLEVLLGGHAVPSFVILDRDGRVAALPDEDDLETVVRKSGVLAER